MKPYASLGHRSFTRGELTRQYHTDLAVTPGGGGAHVVIIHPCSVVNLGYSRTEITLSGLGPAKGLEVGVRVRRALSSLQGTAGFTVTPAGLEWVPAEP